MKGRTLLSVCGLLLLTAFMALADITLTSNASGTYDGYYYELWKDSGGYAKMIVKTGGRYYCEWSGINNVLFRTGKKYGKRWDQLGNITVTYAANYQPNGNSYLCIYGWSRSPLVEFYIVESWGSWRPPGATKIATVTIDGGTYDIYKTTRYNAPSIEGTKTFNQYWSVRTSKRTSGTVSVSQHFRAWVNRGLSLGTIDQITLCVEGYQSSGKADVTRNSFSQ
jgi:endo-1,4-beta-xylanase